MRYTSDLFHLNADNKISKPQKFTQRFLVNMTLEKPPRGKPVKRKFIMELEEKYYSRDLLSHSL
jgi:hypothetical protein